MKTFKRIKKLTEAVEFASKKFNGNIVVADIGTDHGYLAESLSKLDFIDKILATDISEKSLSKLEKLIEKENLKKIETYVGNGLEPIESADISVIAGIGGFEIITILETQNKNSFGNKCNIFVLQPAQNVIELRNWLSKRKIEVLSDIIIEDADRFYPILIVDVSKKHKLKNNIYNIWLGRDNDTKMPDFVNFLKELEESLKFLKSLPIRRIRQDRVLYEKFKLYHLVEKLLKV